MSLEGRQQTNKGYLEAQAFANDPDNNTAPSPSFLEREIGVNAYGLAQIGSLLTDVGASLPDADQTDAANNANNPSASNPYATIEDLNSFSSPTSFFYNFDATAGTPASGEIQMDNADADLATVLRFHNLNRNGANVSNVLLKIGSSDSIIIQDNLESDKFYNFDVTGDPTQVGGTGSSGYVEFPVSLFSQGSTELTSTDVVVAALYPDGGSTPSFPVGTTIGNTEFTGNSIELAANGSGDRSPVLDFWAHDASTDYDGRILRRAGVNGDFEFSNKGTGNFEFITDTAGAEFIFNPNLLDSDFTVFGDTAGKLLFWDGSAGNLGINRNTTQYALDVDGSIRGGNSLLTAGNLELNISGSGDRDSYIDFWAQDLSADWTARIIRQAGADGDFVITNKGTGSILIDPNNQGSDVVVNSNTVDNTDFFVYGNDSSLFLKFQGTDGRLGISTSSPAYTLDVNGGASFTEIRATTIGSTNSIDGAAITAGTIPASSLEAGAGGSNVAIFYVAVTATGDGSGSDTSNRMTLASFHAQWESNPTIIAYFAAGTYSANLAPRSTGSVTAAGNTLGNSVLVIAEGNLTFDSLIVDHSHITFAGDSATRTLTFNTLNISRSAIIDDLFYNFTTPLSPIDTLTVVNSFSVGASCRLDLRSTDITYQSSQDVQINNRAELRCSSLTFTNTSANLALAMHGYLLTQGALTLTTTGTGGNLSVREGGIVKVGGAATVEQIQVAENATCIVAGALTVDDGSPINFTQNIVLNGVLGYLSITVNANGPLTTANGGQIIDYN